MIIHTQFRMNTIAIPKYFNGNMRFIGYSLKIVKIFCKYDWDGINTNDDPSYDISTSLPMCYTVSNKKQDSKS